MKIDGMNRALLHNDTTYAKHIVRCCVINAFAGDADSIDDLKALINAKGQNKKLDKYIAFARKYAHWKFGSISKMISRYDASVTVIPAEEVEVLDELPETKTNVEVADGFMDAAKELMENLDKLQREILFMQDQETIGAHHYTQEEWNDTKELYNRFNALLDRCFVGAEKVLA